MQLARLALKERKELQGQLARPVHKDHRVTSDLKDLPDHKVLLAQLVHRDKRGQLEQSDRRDRKV